MPSHNPLLVANWKMNTNFSDAMVLAGAVKQGLEDIHHVEVVLCPPFPWLVPVAELMKHHPLHHMQLGAQNIWSPLSNAPQGAYTGEVSADMLKHIAKYVIVGHSERVKYFSETSTLIGHKAAAVLAAGLTPIICVGELYQDSHSKDQVVETLQEILKPILHTDWHDCVISYEPVWAISTTEGAKPATGDYAQIVCEEIKKIVGTNTRVLYGGSVDSHNIAEFIYQDDIDGALIGNASLKAKEFLKICEIAAEIKK